MHETGYLHSFECVCMWKTNFGKFVFLPLPPCAPNCHPDPQAAVFRSLRRRDLLFTFGIQVKIYGRPTKIIKYNCLTRLICFRI